jgi:SAM-dependent methyltransferase
VSHVTLQADINASYDRAAATYEADPSHGVAPDEQGLWLDLVTSAATLDSRTRVLDVGAGTGALTRIIANAGAIVTALEPSQGMLDEARKAAAAQPARGCIHFTLGDAHEGDLFASASFDLIVSRQAVCYFADPLRAFANWRDWLTDDGTIIVVDGLWSRNGWGDDALVDRLPLSCLQTRATMAYLLEKSGFAITRNTWLDDINQRARRAAPAAAPRYAIIARKRAA